MNQEPTVQTASNPAELADLRKKMKDLENQLSEIRETSEEALRLARKTKRGLISLTQ